MLTADERAKILATPCPWPNCQSVGEEVCWFYGPKRVRLFITSAEGGFHDARVRKALDRPGRVLQRDTATGQTRVVEPAPADAEREPVALGRLVPAGLSGALRGSDDPECPW